MKPGIAALEVFERIVALPVDRRLAELESACAGRPDLRAEVESLLANDGSTARLPLGSPCLGAGFHVLRFVEPGWQPIRRFPMQIGRYRVDAEIGRGGMGIVYRAEQDRPRRPVALKLLVHGSRRSKDCPSVHQEAQALALLQHPGIVHVYDAGVADVGGIEMPFLAMELVEGEPVLGWIARCRPDVTTRLRILVDVCRAVEAAHRAGVVHRDLKPENILVETHAGEPRPRVLDFGIAELPGARGGDGALAGTVSHLSPEQAAGVSMVDARSDVYALGTIVYRTLTGVAPIDTRGVALEEALRRIREVEPRPLRSHDRALPVDLELVVATALAKSPETRYASARDLARDLEHVLDRQPVSVRRPTAVYLMARFAQRHRVRFASLALAALAVLGTLATGWWAWSNSSANLDRLVATSRFTVERVVERLGGLAGTSTVRAEALLHLLPQIEECLRVRPDDQAALECEYTIVRQLGDIEVDAGRLAAALPLRERALRVQQRLRTGFELDAAGRAEWATALVRVGDVELRIGRIDAAAARYRLAHESFVALAEENPTTGRHLDDLAWSCDRLAHLAIDQHDHSRAEALLRERERLNGQLRHLRPGAATNFAGERAVQCLWSHLEHSRGRPDEVLRRLGLAVGAARQRLATEPHNPQARVEMASTLFSYAMCEAQPLGAAARVPLLDEALGLIDSLLGQEPDHQVAAAVRVALVEARQSF